MVSPAALVCIFLRTQDVSVFVVCKSSLEVSFKVICSAFNCVVGFPIIAFLEFFVDIG